MDQVTQCHAARSRRGGRTAITGALAAAMLTAASFDTSPARAAFPGLNGPIACGGVRAPGTDIELFTVNPDGTGESLLTSNDLRDGSPAYSPDGTKIAFEAQLDNVVGEPANTEIYVANNDGDLTGPDVKRLTFNKGDLNGALNGVRATDFSPSWSPDGKEIVFHSGRAATFNDGGASPVGDFEIYKMSATEGESVTPATRLTVNRGQDAIPSWSPDGTKIAFQGFPPGNDSALFPVNLEVFTMNPDGTGRTNVSNNPGTPNDPATAGINENENGLDRDIIWSPDSQYIAFSSTRASTVVGYENFDVFRARRDGTNVVQLTSNPDAPEPEPFTDFDAPLVWSPDGTKLLFASSRESNLSADIFSAYTMNPFVGDEGPGSVQLVARVSQFQRCDWRALPAQVVTPPPPPAPQPPPPPPPPAQYQLPANAPLTSKLSLSRATIDRSDRELDVLAQITTRASGRVNVELRAAGRAYRFTAAIDSQRGRIRFRKRIPRAQALLGTGILTIRYAGDADTRPQTVRLRAANRHADLRASRPTISSTGRLQASGRISGAARGVVRVQLEYFADGKTTTEQFTARIRNGRWSLSEQLSQPVRDAIARRSGTVHSYILFTGYQRARMRGEMRSLQVLGNR
jgi:TolB protein